MNKSVSVLPTIDKDVLRASIEEFKRNLPVMMEYQAIIAKMRKASFDAHVEQGFTVEQALELCKTTSI